MLSVVACVSGLSFINYKITVLLLCKNSVAFKERTLLTDKKTV
jgi:hypothetical protein